MVGLKSYSASSQAPSPASSTSSLSTGAIVSSAPAPSAGTHVSSHTISCSACPPPLARRSAAGAPQAHRQADAKARRGHGPGGLSSGAKGEARSADGAVAEGRSSAPGAMGGAPGGPKVSVARTGGGRPGPQPFATPGSPGSGDYSGSSTSSGSNSESDTQAEPDPEPTYEAERSWVTLRTNSADYRMSLAEIMSRKKYSVAMLPDPWSIRVAAIQLKEAVSDTLKNLSEDADIVPSENSVRWRRAHRTSVFRAKFLAG